MALPPASHAFTAAVPQGAAPEPSTGNEPADLSGGKPTSKRLEAEAGTVIGVTASAANAKETSVDVGFKNARIDLRRPPMLLAPAGPATSKGEEVVSSPLSESDLDPEATLGKPFGLETLKDGNVGDGPFVDNEGQAIEWTIAALKDFDVVGQHGSKRPADDSDPSLRIAVASTLELLSQDNDRYSAGRTVKRLDPDPLGNSVYEVAFSLERANFHLDGEGLIREYQPFAIDGTPRERMVYRDVDSQAGESPKTPGS